MSRPRKMHKPLKGEFNDILAAIGLGTGQAKRAAKKHDQIIRASEPEKRVSYSKPPPKK
jgi:hypothetical protein